MKTKLIIILLAVSFTASAKKQTLDFGYLVAFTSNTEGLKIIKTKSIVDVYTLAELQFPNNNIDFTRELKYSVYFEMANQHKGFFVEVKKINKRGKYRRLSCKQFNKLFTTK